jgi:hypothetical protein
MDSHGSDKSVTLYCFVDCFDFCVAVETVFEAIKIAKARSKSLNRELAFTTLLAQAASVALRPARTGT